MRGLRAMASLAATLGLVVSSFATSLVAAPPVAAAGTGSVTVRVTIDAVAAVDCFEGTFLGGCLGAADFYAVVGIDGVELPQGPVIDDQDNADPNPDWVFERAVDVSHGPAPVSIAIYDQDGGLRGDDDQADIDSTNGGDPFALDLSVQLQPRCQVSGDATIPPERCGLWEVSEGSADGHRAKIRYKVEVIDPDTDGDSLPDSWETAGLDADGNGSVDVDLPAMGADPRRKDLFLEIDCLVAADHTHCPQQGAIQTVVQAFANAPVSNPDGSAGIQLHVDVGTLYGQSLWVDTKVPRTGGGATGSFGDYGGGGSQIAEAGNTIVDWDGATGRPAANFYDLKAANFDSKRALAFRYGIFVHQVNARAASNDCTSGWAEGGVDSAGAPRPGNDLMVSLGGTRDGRAPCWGADAGGASVGTQAEQAGTLLHEFGHTLSLDHGGGDAINNKPNYLSVMNYSFQACAVPVVAGQVPGGCDLSRSALATLNEALPPGLDECAGIGLGLGGVDWDRSRALSGATCSPSSANVSANVNGDFNDANNNGTQDAGEASIIGSLPGYDDWQGVQYAFQTDGSFADGSVPPFRGEADPELIAASRAFMAELLKPVLTVDKTGPSDATPGDSLAYAIDLVSDGSGPAFGVTLSDTLPDGSSAFSTGLGDMVLGASAHRTASYAVPCSATDGSTVTNTATATGKDLLGNSVTGSDAVVTTIHAPVLTLSKTATATSSAGEAITYRLTYANAGSAAAASVTVTDTLPAGVYYSIALDQGAGPAPSSVTSNADGTRTLTWDVGALPASSGPRTIEFTARTSLLALSGTSYTNSASVAYSNANGCTYAPVSASASTTLGPIEPTQDPQTAGFWKTHPEAWTAETLARIQATDQRFDGADGSAPDGALSAAEMTATLGTTGMFPDTLRRQLLATYCDLATRRIEAGTTIRSKTASRLGVVNVREAALYAQATLALPVSPATSSQYSAGTTVLDEINSNKSEVY